MALYKCFQTIIIIRNRQTAKHARQWQMFVTAGGWWVGGWVGGIVGGMKDEGTGKGKNNLQLYFETLP